MKILKTLYENKDSLLNYLKENTFEDDYSWLVRIHASTPDKELCESIAKAINEALPKATVTGCSVSGVIYDSEIYDNETLILFTGFEKAAVKNDFFSIEDMSDSEIISHVEKSAEGISPALAIIHVGKLGSQIESVVKGISEKLPHIPFIGGVAGCQDPQGNVISVVFDEKGVYENAIAITYISGDFVLAYTNPIVGHAPISDVHTITSMTDDCINEIDGKPSVEWISEQLGIDQLEENIDFETTVSTDVLLRFPFVLEGCDGASRFVRYDDNEGKLRQYYTQAGENTEFRLGYVSPIKSVEEWQNLCYDLHDTPAETMFCYSCLFRKLFLNNLSKWEMAPFKGQDVCGAFMFGEICAKNSNTYFYNGTCAVLTMAERAVYIKPNLNAYERFDELDDTNSEMVKTLENIAALSAQNEGFDLFKNAIENENISKGNIQAYTETIGSFLYSRENGSNLKICIVKLDNEVTSNNSKSSMDIAKLMTEMKDFVNTEFNSSKTDITFFRFRLNSFFFTAENSVNDIMFIKIVKELFSKFANDNDNYNIIKFAVSLEGKYPGELLEYIKKYSLEKTPKLLNCDDFAEESDDLQREFKIVDVIKDALDNNRITPYFQGIYDNKRNNFFAYEALMRIQTSDGKILLPGEFLEISKKHDLYLKLSRSMVFKVLELFAERTEVISINISFLDINSPEFVQEILSRLDSMSNPGHFIFELVETEKYANQENLRQFIRSARNYGVKIAIDDFGSGYSNFIEIGNLEIDYIKINGSLMDLLDTDASYNQILESIFFLSKKMQVDLIAESVETSAVQKKLISSGIRYSQGFLFSKPMPIEQLNNVSSQNIAVEEEENNTDTVQFFANNRASNKIKYLSVWSGIIVAVLFLIATYFFTSFNVQTVEESGDTFLVELATIMTDKISSITEDSSDMLLATERAVFSHYPDAVAMSSAMRDMVEVGLFDAIYISVDDQPPVNSTGKELSSNIELELRNASEKETEILPPATDLDSNRDFFAIAAPIYIDDEYRGEIYGIFYIDNFASVLDLKSFGGEAFYHLCQVDGTPLIVSGSSDNAFAGGDMYEFISTLSMTNGHTPESLRVDMENGNNALLKYELNGEARTAVMAAVPGTDWCVVSVLLNDVTGEISQRINNATLVFTIFVLLIFTAYLAQTIIEYRRNEKILKKAYESSQLIANSLQSTVETDYLTKTYSRLAVQEKISEAIQKIKKEQSDTIHALLILDIDNFKMINDTYGHKIGDEYLLEFVSSTKSSLKAGDILGRLGGDEFIVLLKDISTKENATKAVKRIISNSKAIVIDDVDLSSVGVSIGAIMISKQSAEYTEVNNMADKALYSAKNAGKSTYEFYEDIGLSFKI